MTAGDYDSPLLPLRMAQTKWVGRAEMAFAFASPRARCQPFRDRRRRGEKRAAAMYFVCASAHTLRSPRTATHATGRCELHHSPLPHTHRAKGGLSCHLVRQYSARVRAQRCCAAPPPPPSQRLSSWFKDRTCCSSTTHIAYSSLSSTFTHLHSTQNHAARTPEQPGLGLDRPPGPGQQAPCGRQGALWRQQGGVL